MSPLEIPKIQARRIDENYVDHSDGFFVKPFHPFNQLSHDERLKMRRGETKRCGYCGENVLMKDWDAHKRYCWFGGGPHPTWFNGAYKHSKKLRIIDRQWAQGDRNVRR